MSSDKQNKNNKIWRFVPLPEPRYGDSDEAKENYYKSVRVVVRSWIITAVAFITLLIFLLGGIFTIGAGEIGIVTRFGEVSRTAESGLGFKNPFTEKVIKMNTRIQKEEVASGAATKDLQDVSVTLALNYSIDKETALDIYKRLGVDYKDSIITPALSESLKGSAAKYTAEELITNRAEMKETVYSLFKERMNDYGINVVDLNIVNLEFSAEFNAAIEAKQVAQQNAEKAKQDLERIKVEAEQTRTKADAEAYANEKRKQTLTQESIQQQWIEKWDGKLPSTMTGDNGVMLNLGN